MNKRFIAVLAAIIILVVGIVAWSNHKSRKEQNMSDNTINQGSLRLTSTAFEDSSAIPNTYTCKGQNINPPLDISGVPGSTKSLVLIVHDPDAPVGDFVHWLVWNITPDTTKIGENSVPASSVQGTTDFGNIGYGGPCPPSGTNRYFFELYSLDSQLGLSESTDMAGLRSAMAGHIIDNAKLIGLFSK